MAKKSPHSERSGQPDGPSKDPGRSSRARSSSKPKREPLVEADFTKYVDAESEKGEAEPPEEEDNEGAAGTEDLGARRK